MNKTEPLEIVCDICGKAGAKIRHVSRSYGKGETLLVIENVPIKCANRQLPTLRRELFNR
jgi:YgiT-type zinc finger domain-containing protein